MMRRHLDAVLSFVISVLMVISMVPTSALSVVAEGTSGGDASALGGDVLAEPVKDEATSPAVPGDGAGNVSFDMDASLVGATPETRPEAVPEVSPETVRVRFSGGYDGCDDAAMSEAEMGLDGAERALPACVFVREGFEFSGWSTTVDGRDIADNPETADVDESMRAISVPDSQALVDLRFLDADGHEVDLRQCVRGGMLSLYAQWRALPRVTLSFDANGGEGSMEAIDVVANGNVWVLPVCSLSRDGFSFAGWSVDGTDVRLVDGAELADGDVVSLASHAKDGRVMLRAVWEAKALGDTVPSGDKGDVAMTDDSASGDAKSGNVSVGADVDGSVEVTVDVRGDSGTQAGAVSEKSSEGGAGSEAVKGSGASEIVSSGADSGKSEGEAAGDAASKASGGETVDGSSDQGEAAGKTEGVSYVHRLIVRPKAGVGARAEDVVLGRSGDVLLLGFATKADMDAARTWYEPRCDLVAEDIALGASEGEGDVAQVSMDGNDNPFKALGEAEEAPVLSRLGVTVALLDTGAPSGVASVASMVSDDGADRNGHASMMFEAMRGQNEHVRVMGVKVLDDAGHGTASSVYAGVMYAVDNGADVINMSFAGPDNEGNAAIAEAVRYALDHGVVVVAAAGNGGYDAGLVTPANVEGVFTVGAAEDGKVRNGSNRGECVDVYVEATSTSVAAAKVSGQVSLGLDGWRDCVVERLGVDVGVVDGGSGDVEGDGIEGAADTTVYWGVSGSTLYLSASSGANHTNSKALSSINYMSSVPWYSQRASITTVVIDGAFAPTSTRFWFFECTNLVTFTNWSNLDVSNVSDMFHMFDGCSSMTSPPDMANWDTGNVTNMMYMFNACSSMTVPPNTTNWDTGNVTGMESMFAGCSSMAVPPDTTNWDTGNVTNMWSMFSHCSSMTVSPDTTDWDTGNLKYMNSMFNGCSSMAVPPDTTNWDTVNLIATTKMFYNCSSMTSSPVMTNWNTSNVTTMGSMFYNCSSMVALDVSNLNFSKVTSSSDYLGLQYCSDLRILKVSDGTRIATSIPEHQAQGNYLATWKNDSQSITGSTAADMRLTINSRMGAGTWEWELNVDDYALLDADGTLTFFKAEKGLTPGTGVTVTDMDGTTRTGQLYKVDLDAVYTSSSQVPWYGQRSSIKSVRFAQAMKPSSTAYWFYNYSNLADFDSTNLDTSNVTNMSCMFRGCSNASFNPNVSNWDTSKVTDMNSMFSVCTGAVFNPDVSSWDTSSVTNMSYMFNNCYGAAFNPNVSAWNTSNVTNMSNMFSYCRGAAFNPNVSAWNTSNVTNMSDMFSDCYGAAFNPNVSAWDTSSVRDMGWMFDGCYGATFNPDVSSWNTSKVTTMSRMFNGCSGASFNPNVSSWNTSKVTDMVCMFSSCRGAAFNPDVSSWDTSSVTNMHSMFSNCRGAAFNPDVSSWNTSKVTDMGNMFSGCTGAAFTSLDVSGWGFTKITSTSNYLGLQNCTNLRELKVSSTSKIAEVPEHSAQGLYLSTWGNTDRNINGSTAANMVTTINAGNGAGMWEWETVPVAHFDANGGSGSMEPLVLGSGVTAPACTLTVPSGKRFVSWNTASDGSGVTYAIGDALPTGADIMLYAQWELDPLAGTAYAILASNGLLTFFRSMDTYSAGADQTVTDIAGNSYTGQVYTGFETASPYTSYNSVPWYGQRSSIRNVTIANGQVIKPKGTAYWFYECSNLVTFSDAENLDVSDVTSMLYMFSNCSKLGSSPNVAHWNTGNVTNMSYVFGNCSKMTSPPDVSNWNVSNVTDMSRMFDGCSSMTSPPDTSNWDTGNITTLYFMFSRCYAMASPPDTSDWDTSNVTNMAYMFWDCSSLMSPPDTSTWDMDRVTNIAYMFYSCSKMTSPPDTSNWDTSNITNMSYIFSRCYKMSASPDTSNWDTGSVTSMAYMFSGCFSMSSLPDTSSWDMSSVVDVQSMFSGCAWSSSPDTSNWDTRSITNMSYMFDGCSQMRSAPDMSGWNTHNVTNMSAMFSGCSSLESLDVSDLDFSNIRGASKYLGLQRCMALKQLKVSAGTKIDTVFNEHAAQGDYAATWRNESQSVTRSTAQNMIVMINAGDGAGTWEWEHGYTVVLRAPSNLGLSDVVELVSADNNWSVPANPFTYAHHDFVEWSGSDGNMYDPNDVIVGGTFSAVDTLILSAVFTPHEYSGTLDVDNPDDNDDGLGDNLAFTVPSAVNYVVRADGSLIGPSEGVAYIENRSAFDAWVSAVDVDVETGFNFVDDASVSNVANSVDLQIGPVADMLQASSYLTKANISDVTQWTMDATGAGNTSRVLLNTSGDVSHVDKDISRLTKFGTVEWYLSGDFVDNINVQTYSITFAGAASGYLTADKAQAVEGDLVTISSIGDGDCSYVVYQTSDSSNVIMHCDSRDAHAFVMPGYDVTIYVAPGSGN